MSRRAAESPSPPIWVRRGVRVSGTVQGVGFRPSVHRLATGLGLHGLVRNDSAGVWIEVEGPHERVSCFMAGLPGAVPPIARIDAMAEAALELSLKEGFFIEHSVGESPVTSRIPVDLAPCDACLRELADPRDRRYRYPLLNCTACGPRYTIVRDLPYDRARTTMSTFPMCADCRREYEDPTDCRFHAEPIACPACGPKAGFVETGRAALTGDEAIRAARVALANGAIVAVKGVGGYQLAVDARNEDAVARLRARKRRPHKPFAVMARDLAVAERVAVVAPAARQALVGPARPIVLLALRDRVDLAMGIAPGLREVGLLLPPTPLHVLLLDDEIDLLVMTSGNRVDEPIAIDDAQARTDLEGIADAFVVHERPIHARADDSVVRVVAGEVQPIRRARGFVPDPVSLPFEAPPVLAVGAQMKSTVCLTRGSEAFVSTHIGDLGGAAAHAFFVETIDKTSRLLGVAPELVAHDLHPDLSSTRWAKASGMPTLGVQHHHAHVAACLAEHGHTAPVLGVAFDGTGCGEDGSLWGGEILCADLAGFERVGHLRGLPLAGGEAAIRQPWRVALGALLDAGAPLTLLDRIPEARRRVVRQMIERRIASPISTGAGRWFDAVASLCAVRDEISYDGQPAIELEALATPDRQPAYPFALDSRCEIDLRPAMRAIAEDLESAVARSVVAARFHETLACAIEAACSSLRDRGAPSTVVLTGGCFQNVRLTERSAQLLEAVGFAVLLHRRVPPNDAGVSLGQAAVAAYRLYRGYRGKDVSRHSG